MERLINRAGWVVAGILGLVIAAGVAGTVFGGPLDPPGTPGPTMKTLDQVEPRIPVQSLAGSASAQYVISAPGSYYLTGDIVGVAGKSGINITSSNVTLDLSGYALRGGGTGSSGISSSTVENITVRNGTVDAWQLAGISLNGKFAVVEDVVVTQNAFGGILVSDDSTIRRCMVTNNPGIAAAVYTGQRGMVEDCDVTGNGGDGINSGLDTTVVRNCRVRLNSGDGIRVQGRSAVIGNESIDNDGAGIHAVGTVNHIEGNNVSLNSTGILVDTNLNVIIKNTAGTNTTEYSIAAGNLVGPIVTSATVGSLANPAANFDY